MNKKRMPTLNTFIGNILQNVELKKEKKVNSDRNVICIIYQNRYMYYISKQITSSSFT